MLSSYMYQMFGRSGGRGEYHLLPPFGPEGHLLADSRDAFALWVPIVTKFLAEHL